MPLLWPGWSVNWAAFGIVDLARALGWDIARVLDDDAVRKMFLASAEAIVTDRKLLYALNTKNAGTILTMRSRTQKMQDYLFDLQADYHLAAMYRVLSLGPRLLEILPRESGPSLPTEDNQRLMAGAYIDEDTYSIWLWENAELHPHTLEAIAQRWPGWQVQGHVEGLYRQMLLTGRDPAPIQVSEQQAIKELLAELAYDQALDPLQLAQTIRQTLSPEEQQEMQFGKGFFTNATSPLTSQERREVLERFLLHISENEKLPNTNV